MSFVCNHLKIIMSSSKKLEFLLERVENRQKELGELSTYLSELESQLSLIFAASPDMIIFIHKDGRIIKVSYAVTRILGYDKKEMIDKYIWDFIHPEDIEKTKQVRTELVENRILFFDHKEYFTNRWLKKNGGYAKLAWRFSLYDEREDHTIGIATDVTNLVLDNPFNFGLIHKALSLAKDGIVITDMTQANNPIIYANASFCNNTGYTIQELIGKNCRVLQSDDREQAALSTIRDAVSDGESCEVLLKNFKKDHTIFYNHILISPIVDNGIVTNYIGISRDLTSLINEGVYIWDRTAPRGFGKKQ
jgi:PAS domain S-box-containing protein